MTQAIERPAGRRYTVEEYFALEERTGERHLYLDGHVINMPGGTYAHSRITTNALVAFAVALRGSKCTPVDGNMRVQFGREKLYGYGDLVVHCGPPLFDDADPKHVILLNPTLVVEVLSDSTENWDRTRKFDLYRENPHFREYVLVSQTTMRVETFFKQDDGTWRVAFFVGGDARIALASLGVTISMTDLYIGLDVPTTVPDPLDGMPRADA